MIIIVAVVLLVLDKNRKDKKGNNKVNYSRRSKKRAIFRKPEMVNHRITHNKLRRLTKKRLHQVDFGDQEAFDKWLDQIKSSKNSQQEDLPSSQIPSKMSLINPDIPQLFAVIDTCSIVKFRTQLIDFTVRVKQLYPKNSSPIRFIVSLVVLEELDKCNRSSKKRAKGIGETKSESSQDINNNPSKSLNSTSASDRNNRLVGDGNRDLISLVNGQTSEPPRMFMRYLEEEMRTSEVLVSEFDPFRKIALGDKGQRLEIINKDDRILECCIRAQNFIQSNSAHPDTKVILVTEDNVFKSKATTFGIVSYRWCEFEAKYKNFGLHNYVCTPMAQASSVRQRSGLTNIVRLDISKNTAEERSAERHLKALSVNSKGKRKLELTEKSKDDEVEILKEVIILK